MVLKLITPCILGFGQASKEPCRNNRSRIISSASHVLAKPSKKMGFWISSWQWIHWIQWIRHGSPKEGWSRAVGPKSQNTKCDVCRVDAMNSINIKAKNHQQNLEESFSGLQHEVSTSSIPHPQGHEVLCKWGLFPKKTHGWPARHSSSNIKPYLKRCVPLWYLKMKCYSQSPLYLE